MTPAAHQSYTAGVEKYHARRFEEAAADFRAALEADPSLYRAHAFLGLCYQELGRGEDAIRELRRCIELEPAYAKAYNYLGNALRCGGRVTEALDSFRDAVELDPANGEAWYNIGLTYQDLERPECALEPLRKARQLMPADPVVLSDLAQVLVQVGRAQEAREVLSSFLADHPDHPRAAEFQVRLRRLEKTPS